jgi:acyl carrier protein
MKEDYALPEAEQTVVEAIQKILRRKQIDAQVTPDSEIAGLGLESLDVAELSAILEDDLGRDPYSAGVLPRTVGEIFEWYRT